MSSILLSSFCLILIANSAYASLLPANEMDALKFAAADLNKYNLRIKHTDSSELQLTLSKSALGQYHLQGRILGPDGGQEKREAADIPPSGRLILTYKTGPNEFLTKYKNIQPASA